MICGVFTVSDVPDEELVQRMRGFSSNDPPPLSVNFRTEADGSNTVIATFPPCAATVSHNPDPARPIPTPPSPTKPSPAGHASAPTTLQSAKQAFAILTSGGAWSPAQACGIVANIEAESNFKPSAIGDGGRRSGCANGIPTGSGTSRPGSATTCRSAPLTSRCSSSRSRCCRARRGRRAPI